MKIKKSLGLFCGITLGSVCLLATAGNSLTLNNHTTTVINVACNSKKAKDLQPNTSSSFPWIALSIYGNPLSCTFTQNNVVVGTASLTLSGTFPNNQGEITAFNSQLAKLEAPATVGTAFNNITVDIG